MARTSAGARVELIWNKGISALCDRRFPDEFPLGKGYSPMPAYVGALWSRRLPDDLIRDPSAAAKIQNGELVWVRLSWLKAFVRQVLPSVRADFVLVTGESDSCVPSEIGEVGRAVLESSRVVHWYTQNYDGSMPGERISPMPIGIDFHTLGAKAFWGEDMSSPFEQEQSLLAIGESLPRLQERQRKVYVDFAWQRGFGAFGGWRRDFGFFRRLHPLKGTTFHESRRKLAGKFRGNELMHCQTGPLSRKEMWRRRGEYAFVLSPHGVGLDCHRTWEALALGHIVLVPSSSLDSLYAGLPVVPLRSWNEITSESLDRWLSIHLNGGTSREKLTSCYWANEFRTCAQAGVASAASMA